MEVLDGVKESFSDLGTAFKKVLFGYNEKEAEQAKKNLEQAQKNVDENIAKNGYYNPMDAMAGATISETAILFFAGFIFFLMVIKD